jgi:prophage regulatory protein
LLSNQSLPPKKPSKALQMDDVCSLPEICLDEVSFLRLPELKSVTGLSKSSLYALMRANSFPAPVRLGPRTVAWVRSEVRQWAAERISKSRAESPSISERRAPQRALGQSWATSKKYA